MNGWVIVHKPENCSSRKAGAICAKIFGAKTFGHIGTLDPMASGLLPIGLGTATKMISFWPGDEKKEYYFDVQFGFETDTLDAKGEITKQNDVIPNESDVISAIKKLTGKISQVPPKYSAVHIAGRRAYDLARRGVEFEIKPRTIEIFELEFLGKTDNLWHFRTLCSTGTYVRSIGRDIAEICGTYGTVTKIYRTKTNGLDIKDAVKLDFLENLYNNGDCFKEYLKSTDYGLGDIPVFNLDDKDCGFYKSGGFVKTAKNMSSGLVRVFCSSQFIGIGNYDGEFLKPKKTIV